MRNANSRVLSACDKSRYRHRLIERMLNEVFGMECYKVHDEAEPLEHAVSEGVEARLRGVLVPGTAYPHGSVAGAQILPATVGSADGSSYQRCRNRAILRS